MLCITLKPTQTTSSSPSIPSSQPIAVPQRGGSEKGGYPTTTSLNKLHMTHVQVPFNIYIYIYIYMYVCMSTHTRISLSLSLSICIYIYVYIYIYTYLYIYISIYLSLSLSIYIYISIYLSVSLSLYIYIYDRAETHPDAGLGCGQMGSTLMGPLQN